MRLAQPGALDPRELASTRLALHHAAMIVSGVGRSYAERQPGSRQAALTWNDDAAALDGWPIPAPDGSTIRARLAFDPPAIAVEPGKSVALADRTFDEVVHATRGALAAAGLDPERLALRFPKDIPPGPATSGEPFAPDARAAAELGRWFGFANARLVDAATANGVALPVPCWPDHFDLAVVVHLAGEAQVTLGFSPGDGTVPEPYFYVTAWPLAPDRVAATPAPAHGRWQVEGWTGLVLQALALLAASASGEDAAAIASAFLERGFEVGRDLVLTT